jgi:4-amino-4-deoxy-L-arabinose transferase-like glycosyltransferase
MLLKKQIYYLLLGFLLVLGFYLRTNFNSKLLPENEAILFSEAAKISYGLKPWFFTFNWAPFFISSWHGYFMTILRTITFILFPFSMVAQWTLTAIFGTLVILITFLFAKQLYGNLVAIISSAFISTFTMHVILSRGIYTEMPLTFFILLTFTFFLKGIDKKNIKYIWLSSISLSLGLLTNIFPFLCFPPILFYLFLKRKFIGKKTIKKIILIYFVSILIWLTWAIPNIKKIYNIENESSLRGISYFDMSVKTSSETMRMDFAHEYVSNFSAFGTILILSGIFFASYKRRIHELFILSFIASFVFFFEIISSSDITRFHSMLAPFYFILASMTIVELFKTKIFPLKLVFVILSIMFIASSFMFDLIYWDLDTNWYFINGDVPFPLQVVDHGIFPSVLKLRDLVSYNDTVLMGHNINAFDGFFLDKNVKLSDLPPYEEYCDIVNESNVFCTSKSFEENIKTIKKDNSNNLWIITTDISYNDVRFGNIRFFHVTKQSEILDRYFQRIYENCFPDDISLNKYCIYAWGNDCKHLQSDLFVSNSSELKWPESSCTYIYKV